MKKTSFWPGLLIWIGTVGSMTLLHGQGNLTPPGPPAPSMKTLDQIEPRSLISSAPYTITNSGSFYLATNISGAAGQSGIIVRADNVTLDLNGFALIGVAGSSNGIVCPNAQSNLMVRNGTIRNWGGHGVDASTANNVRVERLGVSSNSGKGVVAAANGSLENCTLTGNGDNGIQAGSWSAVKGCLASQNAGNGILIGANGLVDKCSAAINLGHGIQTGSGSTVKSCLASQNSATGIMADTANNVMDCTAQGNQLDGINCGTESRVSGCLAHQNGRHGFLAGDGVHVDNCDAKSNLGRGVYGGTGLSVRGSFVSNNTGGGILAGAASHVTDCQAVLNPATGISAGDGSTVSHCTAESNIGGGILAGAASHVTDCHAVSNPATGISAGDGSTVSHCTAESNGGDGILVSAECRVTGNNSHSNTSVLFSAGIHATLSKNQIIDNSATSNDRGIRLDSDGNFEVRNIAGNNTVNYFGSTNQLRGPILTTLDDPTTSTQPWANFELLGPP